MKCKKHDVGMEVAPGGHFYCPECEGKESTPEPCPYCGKIATFGGKYFSCSECGEPL